MRQSWNSLGWTKAPPAGKHKQTAAKKMPLMKVHKTWHHFDGYYNLDFFLFMCYEIKLKLGLLKISC